MTTAELLARFDRWVEVREALSAQEESGDYPAPGDWEYSDDEGTELAGLLADNLRALASKLAGAEALLADVLDCVRQMLAS